MAGLVLPRSLVDGSSDEEEEDSMDELEHVDPAQHLDYIRLRYLSWRNKYCGTIGLPGLAGFFNADYPGMFDLLCYLVAKNEGPPFWLGLLETLYGPTVQLEEEELPEHMCLIYLWVMGGVHGFEFYMRHYVCPTLARLEAFRKKIADEMEECVILLYSRAIRRRMTIPRAQIPRLESDQESRSRSRSRQRFSRHPR